MTTTIKSPTYRVYNSHHNIAVNVQAISAADARRLASKKDKRFNHRDTEAEKSWIHESVDLIGAIFEGDTIVASDLFGAMLHEKVAAKVVAKKTEVAKDLIAQALKDKNVHVRMAAAKNATDPMHHAMAMADKHLHVKLAVLNNPHLYTKPEDKEVKNGKSPVEKLINHIKKFKEEDK